MLRPVRSCAPPQQPIPVAIDRFLASHLPDATALHRQKVFDDTANLFGGFDGAVAYFQCSIDVIASGVVLGVGRPPSNAIVKQANVGPLAIFYHSAYPPHLQQSAPFMWNFYIGRRGQGQSSIMKDWSAQGIRVEIMGFTGKWEDILPRASRLKKRSFFRLTLGMHPSLFTTSNSAVELYHVEQIHSLSHSLIQPVVFV